MRGGGSGFGRDACKVGRGAVGERAKTKRSIGEAIIRLGGNSKGSLYLY